MADLTEAEAAGTDGERGAGETPRETEEETRAGLKGGREEVAVKEEEEEDEEEREEVEGTEEEEEDKVEDEGVGGDTVKVDKAKKSIASDKTE